MSAPPQVSNSPTPSPESGEDDVVIACDCPALALGLQNVVVSSGLKVAAVGRKLEQVVPRLRRLPSRVLVALVNGREPRTEELLTGVLGACRRTLLLPSRGVAIHANGLGLSATGTVLLPLTASPDEIRQALLSEPEQAAVVVRPQLVGPGGELSTREQEVLRRLADGASNREIAEALVVTENTVKSHLTQIYRKLSVTRRTEAIAIYLNVA